MGEPCREQHCWIRGSLRRRAARHRGYFHMGCMPSSAALAQTPLVDRGRRTRSRRSWFVVSRSCTRESQVHDARCKQTEPNDEREKSLVGAITISSCRMEIPRCTRLKEECLSWWSSPIDWLQKKTDHGLIAPTLIRSIATFLLRQLITCLVHPARSTTTSSSQLQLVVVGPARWLRPPDSAAQCCQGYQLPPSDPHPGPLPPRLPCEPAPTPTAAMPPLRSE